MNDVTELSGDLSFGDGSLEGSLSFGGGLGGSMDVGGVTVVCNDDYEALRNKPSINSVELVGDKSFEDLGDSPLTNLEIQEIFDSVFN